ncbi:MAG: hypothetical protein Kow0069_33050 [Promethearchaeota archaeon]
MEFDGKIAKISGFVLLFTGIGNLIFSIVGFVTLSSYDGQVFVSANARCVRFPMANYFGVFDLFFLIPAAVLLLVGIITLAKGEGVVESIVPFVLLIVGAVLAVVMRSVWIFGLDNASRQVGTYYYRSCGAGNELDLEVQPLFQLLENLPFLFFVIPLPFIVLFLVGILQDRGVIETTKKRKKKKKKKEKKKPAKVKKRKEEPEEDLGLSPEEIEIRAQEVKHEKEFVPGSEDVEVEIRGRTQVQVEKKKACPQCGFPNDETERICRMCGATL